VGPVGGRLVELARLGGRGRPWFAEAELARQTHPVDRAFGVDLRVQHHWVRLGTHAVAVDTRDDMAPWGHLHMLIRFTRVKTFAGRCLSETVRSGVLRSLHPGEAAFDLRTHTARYGDVARARMEGFLYHIVEHFRPGCSGGAGPTCFTTATLDVGDLSSQSGLRFEAFRYHRGGVELSAFFGGRTAGLGTEFESVDIGEIPGRHVFPPSHLTHTRDAMSMHVKGANGTAFPGSLTYTADTRSGNEGTKDCLQYESSGTSSGTLRAEFDVFGERAITGSAFGEIIERAPGAGASVRTAGPGPASLFASTIRRTASAAFLARAIAAGRGPLDALRLLIAR
jgi:hypothetical protein